MKPDYSVMNTVLRRAGKPPRVPLYEHSADGDIIEQVMGYKLDDPSLSDEENRLESWRKRIRFYCDLGYDYLPMEIGPRFAQTSSLVTEDTADCSRGERGWVDEHAGPIKSMADVEDPNNWPEGDDIGDFSLFEQVSAMLPDGMKIIGGFSGGPFEHASFLMGLEPLSLAIYEQPKMVALLFTKIGERIVAGAERLAKLDGIGAYRFGDDLGYKTSTMLSPIALRRYVFPWYAKVVEVVHAAGKPFLLHSCGQISNVMEDIIAAGVDARHSFEDVIMPVTEAKRLWGDRIAILGGLDVHFLCTARVPDIKERTKRTLDSCAPNGGYAMGTGNTVANYIPVQNYLAMIDATREWNGC